MEENKRQYIEITLRSGLESDIGYMEVNYFVKADVAKRVLKMITPKLTKPRGKNKPTAADLRLRELKDIADGKK